MAKQFSALTKTPTYKVFLAPKEQGSFYNRKTADFYVGVESFEASRFDHTFVRMVSIDDFMWEADRPDTPFTTKEIWQMAKEYLEQLPYNKATEENFRTFFKKKGFTRFAGGLPYENFEENRQV